MNRMQQQVREFHLKFGHVIGTTPAISRPHLRMDLIREEARETIEAIDRGDLVEAVDGLCDLLYVTIGAAVEFGIDIEPIFDEVHRSNMAKIGGATRADGKTLKPQGWQEPDVAGEINKQRQDRLCR
jgi:predicted HAD superfamily Cof-like phosphohydrolase